MKKTAILPLFLFAFTAHSQNCDYPGQDSYKVNRTEFHKGDTITVTIYNRFAESMSYYSLPSACYFSTGTKYNSAPECVTDEDTREKIILRGDSVKFSIITTKDATYFFTFSMAPMLPAQQYECIELKFKEIAVVPKKNE